MELTHGRAELEEVTLHYVESGEGPLVVLLHGFPEFWYSWRAQIRALAEDGFRVVAPDMRGYNRSEKPEGLEAYTRRHLTGDVAQLIAYCGGEEAAVVGHDWGGVVSWLFAMDHPERLRRLGILNCPHPVVMAGAMKNLRQVFRAWHMLFFQLPILPEAAIRLGDFAYMRHIFRSEPVREGAFSEEDIDRYVEAMSRPGAVRGSLSYYRAASRHGLIKPLESITEEVLVVWGEQDNYLGSEYAEPPENLVPNATVERLPDASHWVQVDRPERVNAHLLDFL